MTITLPDRQQGVKIAVVAALFAYTLWAFYPGSYTTDTWDQYLQMTNNDYHDWFDGGLSLYWHFLWKITGHFQSLYIFDMFMYWTFIAMLWWRLELRSVISWIIPAAGIFFSFIGQNLMRDTVMNLSWGFAVLLLLYTGRHESKAPPLRSAHLPVYLAILLLGYGVFTRMNTLIAMIPLIWVAIGLLIRRLTPWKHLLLSLGATLVLFAGTRVFLYKIMHARRAYPEYKFMLQDIGGISKLSGVDYFPDCIKSYPHYHFDTLMAFYSPASFDGIYWMPPHRDIVPFPTAALDSCVIPSWKTAIRSHPFLYLENRFTGFMYYLHIKKRLPDNIYFNALIQIYPINPLHLQLAPHKARDGFVRVYDSLAGNWIWSGWLWLLMNSAGLIYFFYHYRRKGGIDRLIQGCIQLSGVLYIISQFLVFQSDRDFRLFYWNVFVALFAVAALAKKRRSGDHADIPAASIRKPVV
jgi:hypothetical protein